MLYSRARSIQGRLVLERARDINFSSLSYVLYSRARSIRGARSNQGNTVCIVKLFLRTCQFILCS